MNRNTHRLLFTAAAIFIIAACSDDDDGNANNVNAFDRQFANNATIVNRSEIELGALASERGQHASVKMFGQMMQTEHKNALNELEDIADNVNVDTPDGLDNKHQQLKARLMTLSGHTFDTAYINSQVKGHTEAQALFDEQTKQGSEEQLKNYAAKILPHIRMHLHKADSIKNVLANNNDGD